MTGAWKLEDSRLVQLRDVQSGAGDTALDATAYVPAGKIWVITAFGYYPSVNETKIVSVIKSTTSASFALINPVSLALNPNIFTFIEQGMEYLLFPGEKITVRRDSATAGSTMRAFTQIIEVDQPLYTYEEPQIVKREKRAISSIRQAIGGGGAGVGGAAPPTGGSPRPGGGGPLPV